MKVGRVGSSEAAQVSVPRDTAAVDSPPLQAPPPYQLACGSVRRGPMHASVGDKPATDGGCGGAANSASRPWLPCDSTHHILLHHLSATLGCRVTLPITYCFIICQPPLAAV